MTSGSVDGKVVFLGATSVGKTAIVNRAMSDSFEFDQPSTVGAHYSTKPVTTDSGTATLRIWDTAGQERYRSLAPMYYQGSQVAIIVFSLTDRSTLDAATRWANELKEHFEVIPDVFLVGNKADLEAEREIDLDLAMEVASNLNAEYMETSAMTGQNIQDLFNAVADRIVKNRMENPPEAPAVIIERFKPQARGCKC
jgi:Ras-related protein Rab-5C